MYDMQHRAVGTRDDNGESFFVVFLSRAQYVAVALQLYFACLTLQLWSYASFTRFYYGALSGVTASMVYLSAIIGGLFMTFFIALYFLWCNWSFDAAEGTSPPTYIASQKRERAMRQRMEQQQQQRHHQLRNGAGDGEDAANATMEEISLDHIAAAPPGESSTGKNSSVAPDFGGDGMSRLLQVVHPCRGLDYFEDAPRLEGARTFRAVTRVIGACWVFEVVVTVLDVAVFLEITDPSSDGYRATGGVDALFGISLLVGTALSLFPPWYVYQRHMVKIVEKWYA